MTKLVPGGGGRERERTVPTETIRPDHCGDLPYPAAFEHSRVYQVRAHQSHVNAILL